MAGYPDTFVVPSSGTPGPTGPQGPKGDPGLSAYEVALANGFVGTEEEWLASLVGPQGEPGEPGEGGGGAGNLEAGPGIAIAPGTEPGYTKLSVKSTFPFFDTNGSEKPIALNP